MCWLCSNAYRCYGGIRPPSNICGTDGGTSGVSREESHQEQGVSETTSLLILFVSLLAIGLAVSACIRHRRQLPLHAQGVQGMQMHTAQPGQPMPGMPVGTVVGCPPAQSGYPVQSGYGGGTVAAGAGMGFLGGMMVSDMMMHHGGGYGGGGYGDGGGGGYGDGGGGGGFGGDFSADM